MAPLQAWSSARYTIPLPPNHRFPIEKYALLRDAALAEGLIEPGGMHEPERARLDDLLLVHTQEYVQSIVDGTLSPAAQRALGLPWSPELAERSFRAVGGTCEAAVQALTAGVAINLAGGTHHAFPDRGEGYCVFNDIAVAIRRLQRQGRIVRAAIIDLDVHQGNGTHAIFQGDPLVYTMSMHGDRNYPFRKVPGSLDIELADGTGDDEYLERLRAALPRIIESGRPDIVMYLAGADPLKGDRLGRLALTHAGLAQRDELVMEWCDSHSMPVTITIAGGYASDIGETVAAHLNTVRVAGRLASRRM